MILLEVIPSFLFPSFDFTNVEVYNESDIGKFTEDHKETKSLMIANQPNNIYPMIGNNSATWLEFCNNRYHSKEVDLRGKKFKNQGKVC